MQNASPSSSTCKRAWAALLVLTIAAPAIVAVPIALIMPFKPQTAAGLTLSYALRRVSPIATPIALAAAAALAFWLFPAAQRWWRRAALILCLVPIAAAAFVARQNIYERMFAPLPDPAYVAASEASFVAETDMVLALASGGDRAAYPVRQVAYHHIVNDVVGGKPIVVTY